MSVIYGLGMFLFGVVCLVIASTIAYFIIKQVMKEKKEPTRFDDLEWKREYTLTNIKLDLIKKII